MKGRILLIEDDKSLSDTIRNLLEINDFEITVAGNGVEGLSIISDDATLDLILCDITLPDINGYDLLDIVKKNEITFGVPFVFLSGKVSDDDVRYAMNNGADDYIKKPFVTKSLLDAIQSRILLRRVSLGYINKRVLTIIDNHFNENYLNTLSSIYNGAFTIATATEIMNNHDFGEAIGEIYKSTFRLHKNAKNLMFYLHLSMSYNLPDSSGAPILFINDIVSQLVEYYNKTLPTNVNSISGQIDFVPLSDKEWHNTVFLQYIFSELIDNAITHSKDNAGPTIKLTGNEEGFEFKIINSVADDLYFSIDGVQPFKKIGKSFNGGGLGLGLYNCKRLCDALGLNLAVRKEGSYIQFELAVKY